MKAWIATGLLSLTLTNTPALAVEKKADAATTPKTVDVKVTKRGFEPPKINLTADAPVTLKVTRETDKTCATEIVFTKLNIKKNLPLNQPVLVDLGKLEKGQELKFACGMDMISCVVVVQ